MRIHTVSGADGVALHVRDVGPEDAPAILMIHGWSQHHLCWSRQMGSGLARRFRLVAPDLRGHGASGKPDDPAAYDNSAPWAGDVAAIIAALGLDRPVLVGWSMGGWVVCDYLRVHGERGIAGFVLVGSGARSGRHGDAEVLARRRPEVQATGMYSDDQPTALAAAVAFVRACFAAPPSKRDLALMTGYTMLCPPHVRHAARTRDEDYRPVLANLTVPALMIWGEAERVCLPEMAAEAAAVTPGARTITYPGSGHLPFWEAAERFNTDLGRFAAHAHGVSA